jgi:iron complex outermembrane receptor protein
MEERRLRGAVPPLVLLATLVAGGALWAVPGPGGDPPPGVIAGHVTDRSGQALAQVAVQVLDIERSAVTDESGAYTISGVPNGTYTVSFRLIGYAPVVRRVTVGAAPVTLDVAMTPSPVELPSVQVTATASATNAFDSPQPTAVLDSASLRRAEAPSLGETLEGVAGVHSLSTGVGIGKPVIRGLTSNRVLILDGGQRLETQQWGDEHGPQIEAADAQRIEVIRGPASVLYGSDALGGVINVIPPDVPEAIDRDPFVHGSVSGGFTSGNRSPDGTLALEGASGGLGFRAEGTGRTSQDVRTPDYVLWNSGDRALTGTAALGYHGSWGLLTGRYTYRDERIELTDEDSTATPYQRIGDHRARADLTLPLGASRLQATVGYERNRRREFEDAAATAVSLGLLSTSYTADVHLHHPVLGPFSGIVGLSGEHTGFAKFGEETLIPDTRANDLGLYAFEQTDLGRWSLALGARYEYRRLAVDGDTAIGVAAQTRTWSSVTGNVGVLYHVTPPVALVLNVGRGFRAPSSFELFSNGVHEGTLAFERGNADLRTEKSLNTDLAVRVLTPNVLAEVGGFVNAIQDFIFTVPTTQTDSASGYQIFDVAQGDALLTGVEASVDVHPTSYLHLHGTADYVRGQNTTTHEPLPAMPPFRATYALRFEPSPRRWLRDAYVSIGGESNARQTRLNPAEAEFFAAAFDGAGYQSQGYTLVNLAAGFGLPTAGGRSVHLDVQLRNLLNTSYADFLSRIKTNALDPGAGRSLTARISTTF